MKETKCPECGAYLRFDPDTTGLKCPYCASEVPIVQEEIRVEEWDYHKHITDMEYQSDIREILTVKCTECGAEISLPANVTADVCPYCATSLVAEKTVSKKAIKPRYLLAFGETSKKTNDLFKSWLRGLWFAPGDLKKYARADDAIKGIYTPYWTFDADTVTHYTGARGDYYLEPAPVTAVRNGKMVTETRMVQKIRWTPASGSVFLRFDDLLVLGSKSLPPNYAKSLEPWDLDNLVGYDDRYLSGFMSESYQIGPRDGFEMGKARMEPAILAAIKADIGGNVQQIHSLGADYDNIRFKHILLPVWIRSYRFRNKLYRFLVNARTGEVQGDRPWSTIKIVLFGAGMALLFACFYLLAQGNITR